MFNKEEDREQDKRREWDAWASNIIQLLITKIRAEEGMMEFISIILRIIPLKFPQFSETF